MLNVGIMQLMQCAGVYNRHLNLSLVCGACKPQRFS